MREARFVRDEETLVEPLSLELDYGDRLARTFSTPFQASIVALMAAGIVKATSGRVFISEYDPIIQPVQVKRLVGFVPHEAVSLHFRTFATYIEYRAALWSIPKTEALDRASAILHRLDGVHEAFAYPLVGALMARPELLVLDRPQAAYAKQILEVAGAAAVFSTHTGAREAAAFGL